MPQRDRIDEIYRQLGMMEQSGGLGDTRLGSTRLSGGLTSGLTSAFDSRSTDALPPAFQHIDTSNPAAVERTGALTQFLHGLGSPVMDTLRGLGMIEGRPEPVGFRENLASLAGTLIGWGATLSLPGIGKGVSAAGAGLAKVLTSAKVPTVLAGKMGKSMAISGVMGTHRAWHQEKPLGKELLYSTAFGAVAAGGFHAVGKGLQKIVPKLPTTHEYIEKHAPILSVTDEKSMLEAMGKIPANKLKPATQQVMQNLKARSRNIPERFSEFDLGLGTSKAKVLYFDDLNVAGQAKALISFAGEQEGGTTMAQPLINLASVIKGSANILKDNKRGVVTQRIQAIIRKADPVKLDVSHPNAAGLTVKQMETFKGISEAKTLGEQFDGLRKLSQLVNSNLKSQYKKYGVTNIKDLYRKMYDESLNMTPMKKAKHMEKFFDYEKRLNAVQDATWNISDHISKAAQGDRSIALPPLSSIKDPFKSKQIKKLIVNEFEKGEVVHANNLQLHPKLREFLKMWGGKENKSYTNTSFMPRTMKKEWDTLVKQIKDAGDAPQLYHYGIDTFPVPAEITAKQIPAWLANQADMPQVGGHLPISIQEALKLERDIMPIFGRFLTPIRHALGNSFANTTRKRVEMHNKFVDKGKSKLEKWMGELNVRKKDLSEAGERIGSAMEGKIPETQKATLLKQAANFANLDKLPQEGKALQALARKSRLTVKQLKNIHTQVSRFADDSEAQKVLKHFGTRREDIAAYHILAEKLKGYPKMKDTTKKAMVDLFGLKNEKELKVMYEMRKEFDSIFKEAGLDWDRYIVNYLPHFKQSANRSYNEMMKSLKDLGLPEAKIKRYLWINEMPREGTSLRYEQNAFNAMAKYISGYSKQKHYDDLFETWNKVFKSQNVGKQRLELFEDLKSWMVGKPSSAEQQLDALIYRFGDTLNKSGWDTSKWGERPTAEMSSFLAELQYMGGIGFNPFTAAKNLTQKGLALANITDDGNPLHGLKWMMKARNFKKTAEGKLLMQNNNIIHSRQFMEGLDAQHSAITRFLDKRGAPDAWLKASDKVRDKAFAMFRKSDISNVEDTWMAKFLYLTQQKGAPMVDAINLSTSTTMATQFMYGFDSPMLYKGPIGRQLGVFTSWPINWAHLMMEQGGSGELQRAITSIGVMAVGAEMLSLTGMNFLSVHPVNTVRGLLPLSLAEGQDRWPIALRTGAAIQAQMRALADGDPQAVDLAFQNLKNRMRPLIPMGVVSGRILDSIDLARNDWNKIDERGRTIYEGDISQGIRGALGPTMEAHKRMEDWRKISKDEGAYRKMRRDAIDAFLENDFQTFERLQEQLVINFGTWVEPQDIVQEEELRSVTSRERQLRSMPGSYREPFLERSGSLYRREGFPLEE